MFGTASGPRRDGQRATRYLHKARLLRAGSGLFQLCDTDNELFVDGFYEINRTGSGRFGLTADVRCQQVAIDTHFNSNGMAVKLALGFGVVFR